MVSGRPHKPVCPNEGSGGFEHRSCNGRLAQLVARFLDMEEVTGSSPVSSTMAHSSSG